MSGQCNGPQPIGGRASVALLRASPWQMSYGERAALEGLLSQRRPELALEIGTAEGGSLERFAEHCGEVRSFDLVEPSAAARELSNVHFHTGDSHVLLPQVLAEFADNGRTVDFVLVDGDHSTEGVRQDMEDLLRSPATSNTIIVMHDTMNDVVRAGLEQVDYEAWPKVAYVELDMVAGYMFREPTLLGELWGGLGLVLTAVAARDSTRPARQRRYFDAYTTMRTGTARVLEDDAAVRDRRRRNVAPLAELDRDADRRAQCDAQLAGEVVQLRSELEALRADHAALSDAWDRAMSSVSWTVTRPLRDVKSRVRRLLA